MIIAIDYDDTFTRDSCLWIGFITQAIARGHTVYCVTARSDGYDSVEVEQDLAHIVHEIYYTCGKPKEKFMLDQGICVQVWIDDCPQAIVPRVVLNEYGEEV